ncbi:MAG: hypothetical protein MUP67_01800 [Acidimicrobiia bacterium]|nr:hypothetical protein [Acidimicrobiia bacterium]
MVVGIELMGATWRFVFYAIALVVFIAGGVGIKPGGERVSLVAIGLAALTVPLFWDNLAQI